MRGDTAVAAAIERWVEQGLITTELAERLRAELMQSAAGRHSRLAQYIIAGTAAVALLTAAGLFVARGWPLLTVPIRTFVLGAVGVGLLLAGMAMEPRFRVRPVSYLLQTSGLLMLLVAYAHSDETWAAGTLGGIVAGILALATPIVSTLLSVGRNPVMPAVNAAIGYAFLAFFLDRIGVDDNAIVWILDVVLLLSLTLLTIRLRAAGPDTPGVATALYAFVASMVAGLVLIGLTAAGPLDAGGETIYALDIWLGIIVATALWAIHRAPAWLRRSWYDDILGACVLFATVLAFFTLDELGVSNDWLGLGGAAVGSAALYYGVRTGTRTTTLTGCLAIVVSVWHFGLVQGRSIGAVAALAFTAGLLFWVSSRLGSGGSARL